jgi:hypothetical protein
MHHPIHVKHNPANTAILVVILLGMANWPASGQQTEPLDLEAIALIQEEGLENSEIMETAWFLADRYGSRLTGSSTFRAAAEWARDQMTEWGLSDARLEAWGPFGPGWENERFYAHVVEPQPFSLIGYPESWTSGTDGWVRGEAVVAEIHSIDDFEQYRGTLMGKFVLTDPLFDTRQEFEPLPWNPRYTVEELDEWAKEQTPERFNHQAWVDNMRGTVPADRFARFLQEEGAAAWLRNGTFENTSTGVVVAGAPFFGYLPSFPQSPPIVTLLTEHYGRIYRTVNRAIPVTLEIDIRNRWFEEDSSAFNVLAEIPGTDRSDEVVMMGGHLDCLHTGTGGADNAAGVALVMEAARILKVLGLPLSRTVRVALWSAEETPGFAGTGAYAYVNQHLFDADHGTSKPEHAKLSAYFNVDYGSGRFRGIVGARTDEVAAVLSRWIEPFRDYGLTMVSLRTIAGSDHNPFDFVGIPSFFFLQDFTTNHFAHANLDTYERLLEDELMQNAVILASLIYHAANRETSLPRQPTPRQVSLPQEILERYTGEYEVIPDYHVTIEQQGGWLVWRSGIPEFDPEMFVNELRPLSETEFFVYGPHSAATGRGRVTFTVNEFGEVQGLRRSAETIYYDARKVR